MRIELVMKTQILISVIYSGITDETSVLYIAIKQVPHKIRKV